MLRAGVTEAIARHGLANHFELAGQPCNLIYRTKDENGNPSQALRTLFLQELIRGGILAPSFVVSFSHTDQDIEHTIDVVDQALGVYALALQDGIHRHLLGRPVKPVNRKFA
jgi:glutamate-1-semialdehyde 2,1-aminomutase